MDSNVEMKLVTENGPDDSWESPEIRKLDPFVWSDDSRLKTVKAEGNRLHGTGVLAKAIGWRFGLAKLAQGYIALSPYGGPRDMRRNTFWETSVGKLVRVYNEVKRLYVEDPSLRGKIILTEFNGFTTMEAGVLVYRTFQQRWQDLVMAPGRDVMTTGEEDDGVYVSSGNLFAAPTIACLVAYWRGLLGIKNGWDEELKKPANVKKLLMYMHRPLFPGNRVDGLDESKVGANKNKPKGRDLVPSATPSPFRRAQQMSPAPRNLQDAVPSAPVSIAARPPQRTHRPPCHRPL
ncbi:uncharacterized protein PODANS_1_493 [Podospora anserina S mat+]|uniref:Podospora anserina S mat+ genomic DNA chromosome 1, supercontig 1 n=1 Tax=Podospora anserina (strain S / ATCC MYA-4624 / DSM 980 / FGSC 10383) TaxID=515849 RepID=B2A9F7_PODAN|nr:uncharacterized protein PODANS_1_493 [Podospora anserina S mat+]CAP59704.1 unnamed protein product [Podospora anserina S mat+]CDP22347.1 Putative protein of unknown function [Podospora anserina S mat+]